MNITKINGILILCGNDGTGKTTLTQLINEMFHKDKTNLIVLERSDDLHNKFDLDPEILDRLTLKLTFEERPLNLTETINISNHIIPVYWIILDAELSELEKRLTHRDTRDRWESPKALFYYKYRFRELAAHYGLPIVDTTHKDINVTINELLTIPQYYQEIRKTRLSNLTFEMIDSMDIENLLVKLPELIIPTEFDDLGELKHVLDLNPTIYKKLTARWLINGFIKLADNKLTISRDKYTYTIDYFENKLLFKLLTEGESKKVYQIITDNPYLENIVIIVLKSTIYSHSKQATGVIANLGEIRAEGSQLFLEMMWRNGLKHSYRSINKHGIIISDYISTIPPTEIVVKKYCEGTDKHSYYQLKTLKSTVLETGEYICGPYVRFDWRNPNHLDITGKSPNENPYYYLIEEAMGKEKFFEKYLSQVKPFGDRSINEELVANIIDTKKTRETVLKMFYTIQAYFHKVNLEIKDVCFMLDSTGQIFWSEINQDCMRIKTVDNSDQFDKDIWRAGGSSSKELLINKWIAFNQLFKKYFIGNRFYLTEQNNIYSYPFQKEMQQTLHDSRLKLLPNLSGTLSINDL